MVTYIEEGNIFKLENTSSYAHGCNCAGAMGKGIALQFKERYPFMYLEYKKLCQDGAFNLGDVYIYKTDNGVIFNLGTQKTWRTKADINAIRNALFKMLSYASRNNVRNIALPKIGAGLGGLNWIDVKEIIDETSKEYPDINLFVVENYKES